MKISAIYIAKDEEKNIARSLESISDSVDELILVDTGSTDKTKEVFKAYGGQVYDLPWEDDFSAPRNLALSKATGEWIINLDCDEYFSDGTGKNIRKVIEKYKNANGLLIKMDNMDIASGEILDSFLTIRAVRNQSGLSYVGAIHEELRLDGQYIKNVIQVSPTLLKIEHTGYSRNISTEKAQRNLNILQKELANGIPVEELYSYLAECYDILGEEQKALDYACKDVDMGRRPITYASRSYRIILTKIATPRNRLEYLNRLTITRNAVRDFPELPEFHAEYGECLYQAFRYEEALVEFSAAIKLLEASADNIEPSLMDKSAKKALETKWNIIKELADKAKQIKISACAIVKNEEKHIGEWLENTSVYADERIIVDTGSTDNTVKIIDAAGEQCIFKQWDNDFSKAKNVAIDKAMGDWIVYNDADEYYYEPESLRGYLAFIEINKPNIQAIMLPLANVNPDDDDREINRLYVVRIFRNNCGIKYCGRIHETIKINGDFVPFNNIIRADDRLLIKHTGYSPKVMKNKMRRNLILLQQDELENGHNPGYSRYFSECYFTLGDYQRALDYAMDAINTDSIAIGQEGDMYNQALDCMEKLNYVDADKLSIIDEGLVAVPSLPDFWLQKGIVLANKHDYNHALPLLLKGMEIYEDNYVNSIVPRQSTRIGHFYGRACVSLGNCYLIAGKKEEADDYFHKALKFNKMDEDAFCALADSHDCEADDEFLLIIEAVYGVDERSIKLILSICQRNGLVELQNYFQSRLNTIKEIKSNKLDISYQLLNLSDQEALIKSIDTKIVTELQILFVSLLYNQQSWNDSLYGNQLRLLPLNLQNLIKLCHKQIYDANQFDEDAYRAMLLAVLRYGNEEIVQRYLELSEYVTSEGKIKLADILMNEDKWNLALNIYNQISVDDSVIDGSFWTNVGICFYQLGEFETALECLNKNFNENDVNNVYDINIAYKTWCREALGYENFSMCHCKK